MFKIYGGASKFTQWTKDQKLIMSELPIGADVLFYNDPNEDDPLITEVYEIRDEEDNVFRVCDVPNILLTETKKIKVRIPKVVKGLYGNLHKVAGRNEIIFEVESAEKPDDYVYEKTKMNTIDPSRLPEGYPYKEQSETVLVEETALEMTYLNGFSYYSGTPVSLSEGQECTVYIDGKKYEQSVKQSVMSMLYIGNLWIELRMEGLSEEDIAAVGVENTGEHYCFVSNSNCWNFVLTGNVETVTFGLSQKTETIHTMAPEFMPSANFFDRGVTTEGDGTAYTATVLGIESLTAGISFIMIPHTVSTSVTATLDVNGLGAKTIRRPISANTSTTVAPSDAGWLAADKPIQMTYDGTYWVADLPKPYATDIYGTVPVANGGVPACTTADNGKVLKVVDGVPTWVEA